MKIPSLVLKQLYTFGSLQSDHDGVRFGIKNRLSDATLLGVSGLKIDDAPIPLERLTLDLGNGERVGAADLSAEIAWATIRQRRLSGSGVPGTHGNGGIGHRRHAALIHAIRHNQNV